MPEGVPVSEPAPGKLNPYLRVLGRRPDGFHEVETLVQPITLADGVRAIPADDLSLVVAGERASEVPAGGGNLVIRAAEALRRRAGISDGARLLLSKRIFVASGLGGGSADAAAALRALDRLWALGLGPSGLREVAAEVGSDVPALLEGGPVVAMGRGEIVEPVKVARTWWVLLPQPFGVGAADAYGLWDADGGSTGPDPGPLVAALRAGDPPVAGPLLRNDLERPISRRHPEIVEARERLLEGGALGAVMCGSGPTVAGLAADGSHVEDLARKVGGHAVGSVSLPG